MNYKYMMMTALNSLLEDVERLSFPIYATLMEEKKPQFGFFGFTKKMLLVAILDEDQKKIAWTRRIALHDIRKVSVKKVFLLGQHVVDMEFADGTSYKLRISKKLVNVDTQEKNAADFIAHLERKAGRGEES